MSSLVTPYWFKQRQSKVEPAGENCYRLTGPNLGEALISIRRLENGQWQTVLRYQVDGPEVAVTEGIANPYDAWEAAFELYRNHVIF